MSLFRFRLPAAPALVLLAALGVEQTYQLVARPTQSRLLLACCACIAVGLVAAWNNAYAVRSYQIAELRVNAGVLDLATYLDGLSQRRGDA